MLYTIEMVIVGDHNIKKKDREISIFELYKVENCISRLCTNHLATPPPPPRPTRTH